MVKLFTHKLTATYYELKKFIKKIYGIIKKFYQTTKGNNYVH